MKVYAKQINPAYQESPLFLDMWPDDIIVDGNRDYMSHTTAEYDTLKRYLDDMVSDHFNDGGPVRDLLAAYGVYRNNGRGWSNKQIAEWKKIFSAIWYGEKEEEDITCAALELMTGCAWSWEYIRGSCQGDWQTVYFKTDVYTSGDIKEFGIEYFNEGSEWLVDDGVIADVAPGDVDPDDIGGFCVYCHGWHVEEIRREIADAAGCAADDVVLFSWAGSYSVDKWEMEA